MTKRMRIWRFANEIAKRKLHRGADEFNLLNFDVKFSPKRLGGPKVEVRGSEKIEGV